MFLQVKFVTHTDAFFKTQLLILSGYKTIEKTQKSSYFAYGSESCKIELFLFAMSIVLKHRLICY